MYSQQSTSFESSVPSKVTRSPLSIFKKIREAKKQGDRGSLRRKLKALMQKCSGYLGAAVEGKWNFFDSLAQVLNEVRGGNEFYVQGLKQRVGMFAERYKEGKEDEKKKIRELYSVNDDDFAPDGSFITKYISKRFEVKIIIIDLNKQPKSILKDEKNIYIVNYDGHYVPLLKGIKEHIKKEQQVAYQDVYGNLKIRNQAPEMDQPGTSRETTCIANSEEAISSQLHKPRKEQKKKHKEESSQVEKEGLSITFQPGTDEITDQSGLQNDDTMDCFADKFSEDCSINSKESKNQSVNHQPRASEKTIHDLDNARKTAHDTDRIPDGKLKEFLTRLQNDGVTDSLANELSESLDISGNESKNQLVDHKAGTSRETKHGSDKLRLNTDNLNRYNGNVGESKALSKSKKVTPQLLEDNVFSEKSVQTKLSLRKLNINKGTNQLEQRLTLPQTNDNLAEASSKEVRVGEERGSDKEKGRAEGQEEMEVQQSYADVSNKRSQENNESGKNKLQQSKKIKITNDPFYKGNLSRSLIGSIYQVKLLMLLFKIVGEKEYDSFYIGTEVQAAGKFDDLVFQYKKNNKLVSFFLQAKHFQSNKTIDFEDFINKERKHGAFYLKKYFDSYRNNIKGKTLSELLGAGEEKKLIIYTNIDVDDNFKKDSFEELKDKDFILDEVSTGKSKRFKFKSGDFPQKTELVSALKEGDDSVTDQEIENFFKHLIFAVNQPNEKELEKITKKKLGKEFNLDDASFVFSHLLNEGINLAKEEKKYFLSNQEIQKLFEKIKREVATLVAIGPTALSRIKIKDLGLIYEPKAIEDLQNFLTKKTHKVLNLVTEEIYLSAAKVNQVLDNNNYKREDSYIFTSLEDLLTLKYLVEAFEAEKDRLLVVMCKPVKEDVKELFDKLYATIHGKEKKQIVFITEQGKDNSLYSKIKGKFDWTDHGSGGNHYKKIEDKNNSFENLTPKSQENLTERQVTFQGQTIKLGLLATTEFLNRFISGKVLIDLAQDEEIKIDSEISVFDHIDIDRTFCSQVIIKEDALTDQDNSNIFVISSAKPIYSEKFSKVKKLDNNNLESHFKLICEENKESNVHWLSREYSQRKLVLVHKKSQGSPRDLLEHINPNVKNHEGAGKLTQRNLAIISGEPGIGKSSTMARLFRQIKDKNPLLWVVKINLVDCRFQLSKIKINHDNFTDFLSESVQLSTELEKALFKHNLLDQENKIALLFDGFDEIGSIYEEKILSLLKILKDLPSVNKLYISVRPHMKYRLEDSLGILSCELSPLELQDQKKFLQYLLKKEVSGSSNVDEKRISTFVDKLLESYSQIINGAFSLDNPLHLEMLAKFFAGEFQEFCDNGNEDSIKFNDFNYFDLYEYYIKCKICVFTEKLSFKFGNKNLIDILDKNGLICDPEPTSDLLKCPEKQEAINLLTKYREDFAFLSLKELFDIKEEYSDISCTTGLFDEVKVIHSSILEYSIARFFADKCLRDPEDRDPKIFRLLEEYYFHPDGKGVRYFFDLIVSKDCPLHVDVINGNFDEVKRLIESGDEGERKKLLEVDGQGRSILHLVQGEVYKNFANAFSKEVKNAKQCYNGILYEIIAKKDKIFGYTSLEYAIKSGYYKITDKILEFRNWFQRGTYQPSINRKAISNDRELLTILDSLLADRFTQFGSVLHVAVKEGLFYLSLGLIERLPINKLKEEDRCGQQPLYYIALRKKIGWKEAEIFNFISSRIGFNSPGTHEQTPAHFFVMMLLQLREDEISKLSESSWTYQSIINELKQKMDVLDRDGNAPLHLASGRLDVVKFLVKNFSVDINKHRSSDGKNLLHLATYKGDLEMTKYLWYKGASLDQKDNDGNTPLHLAVRGESQHTLEIVKLLVKNGANFEIKNNSQETSKDLASGSVLEYLNNLPPYRQYLKEQSVFLLKKIQTQFKDLLEKQKKLYELLGKSKEQIKDVKDAIEGENVRIKREVVEEAIRQGQYIETEDMRNLRIKEGLFSEHRGERLKLSEEVKKMSKLYEEYNKVLEGIQERVKSLKQTKDQFMNMLQLLREQIGSLLCGIDRISCSTLGKVKECEFYIIKEIETRQEEYQAGRKKQKLEDPLDERRKSDISLLNTEERIKSLLGTLEEEINGRLTSPKDAQSHNKENLKRIEKFVQQIQTGNRSKAEDTDSSHHRCSKRKLDNSDYIDNCKKRTRVQQCTPTSLYGNFPCIFSPCQFPIAGYNLYSYYPSQDSQGIPGTSRFSGDPLPYSINYCQQDLPQQSAFLSSFPFSMVFTDLGQQRQNYVSQSENQFLRGTGNPKTYLSGATISPVMPAVNNQMFPAGGNNYQR